MICVPNTIGVWYAAVAQWISEAATRMVVITIRADLGSVPAPCINQTMLEVMISMAPDST